MAVPAWILGPFRLLPQLQYHWGYPWGHPPSPIPSLSFPPQLLGFQVFSSFQSSASPKDRA